MCAMDTPQGMMHMLLLSTNMCIGAKTRLVPGLGTSALSLLSWAPCFYKKINIYYTCNGTAANVALELLLEPLLAAQRSSLGTARDVIGVEKTFPRIGLRIVVISLCMTEGSSPVCPRCCYHVPCFYVLSTCSSSVSIHDERRRLRANLSHFCPGLQPCF